MSNDPRHRLGKLGEALAFAHFEEKGFEVVARNYRTRFGEIDLVVADAETLVFCEVKTRRSGGRGSAPWDALHGGKQRKVRKMARAWLSEVTERPMRDDIRFDAVGVTIDSTGQLISLEHIEAAF